jgi:HEPN domain-containing protein
VTATDHWLWRLDAGAWLRAAVGELQAGRVHVASRRAAVTHARRAAGMAVNAVLVATGGEELRWGRSYVEHLQALAEADEAGLAPLSAAVRAPAARLMAISPVAPTGLVALARGPHAAADEALAAAETVVSLCAAVVEDVGSTAE